MDSNVDSTLIKRPWTIKVLVGILFPLVLLGLIFYIIGGEYNYGGFILDIVLVVLLIGIWQGSIWARNLFFLLTLPWVLLFGIASGATILTAGNNENILYEFYSAIVMLSIPLLFLLTFLKPSRDWFNTVNGKKSEKKSGELSWQFQLMVIIIAMGCSTLGAYIAPSLLPLAKEFMLNFSTYYSRFAILLGFESLSFWIGNMAILFPISILMGYWKRGNIAILTRLIMLGSSFILLLFSAGQTLLLFSGFFISKVIVIGCIAYGGLILGEKVSKQVAKLKQLNAISS